MNTSDETINTINNTCDHLMITTISEPNKPGGSRRSVSLEHGDPDVHGRNASSTRCEARQLPPITPEERAERIL